MEDPTLKSNDLKFLNVVVHQFDSLLKKTIGRVVWVTHRGEVRNPNKVTDTGNKPGLPVFINSLKGFRIVHTN
ncbi:MAG: hypothetical protein ACK55Z_04740 [bacterium]